MNINFTSAAHCAIAEASNDVKRRALLKNISTAARELLGLPKGTRVFICG